MSDIRFYHLERQSLDQALPALLSKALKNGHRIVVKIPDEREIQRLNDYLWTWRPDSFLPHGSAKDGFGEDQPVWLTSGEDNPNGADVLILTHGTTSESLADYALCCEMLDGRNDEAISAARQRWSAYKEDGHQVTYWQQTEKGWEKKAE